jgi:hypothetical protein
MNETSAFFPWFVTRIKGAERAALLAQYDEEIQREVEEEKLAKQKEKVKEKSYDRFLHLKRN